MIKHIDLDDWKTKTEILTELKEQGIFISDRKWRLFVEAHNKKYADNVESKMIAHGQRGYKLTNEHKDIMETIRDYESRAWNMYLKAKEISEASGRNMNYRMEELE